MKHTVAELKQMQSLPLEAKVAMTKARVAAWIREFESEGCYISFSGGKDSTVLMDIIRNDMRERDIPAMFVDVPTQYPELREFAKTWDNVEIVRPKISFMEVCEKYGFPLISKEVSESVYGARKYLTELEKEIESLQTDRQTDSCRINISTIKSVELANILNERMKGRLGGNNLRLAIMLGMYTKDSKIKANIPSDERSTFSQEKYKFFLEAPYDISNMCCRIMKKNPAHDYHKKTGRNPITAQMADESRLRLQKWVQNGCNGFNLKIPTSNPMSFWTEQDILKYIKTRELPICSVYGEVVEDYEAEGLMDNQVTWDCFKDDKIYKTTGCKRTGCMLCGFGCHLKSDDRFIKLKETHPKMYGLLDVVKNNGVTFREAIEWANEHGNLKIRI